MLNIKHNLKYSIKYIEHMASVDYLYNETEI